MWITAWSCRNIQDLTLLPYLLSFHTNHYPFEREKLCYLKIVWKMKSIWKLNLEKFIRCHLWETALSNLCSNLFWFSSVLYYFSQNLSLCLRSKHFLHDNQKFNEKCHLFHRIFFLSNYQIYVRNLNFYLFISGILYIMCWNQVGDFFSSA